MSNLKIIEIQAPKWKDKVVYVATWKVGFGTNYIMFTEVPSMPGIWSFDGSKVIKEIAAVPLSRKNGNGTFKVYPVPLAWLTQLEDNKKVGLSDEQEEKE